MATNPNLTPSSVTEGAKRPASGAPEEAVSEAESEMRNEDATDQGDETREFRSPEEGTHGADDTREFRSPEEQESAEYEMLSGSKTFDPERLGVFKMSNTFLQWVLKNPPPKGKPENLWKDTLPPGMELRADEPAMVERSSEGGVRVKPLTPRNGSIESGRSWKTPLLVAGGVVLLAIGGVVVWPSGSGETGDADAKAGDGAEVEVQGPTLSDASVGSRDSSGAESPREVEASAKPVTTGSTSDGEAHGVAPKPATENEASPGVMPTRGHPKSEMDPPEKTEKAGSAAPSPSPPRSEGSTDPNSSKWRPAYD